jgi:rod shape-determining protein MreD
LTDILFLFIIAAAALFVQTISAFLPAPEGCQPDLLLILVVWASQRVAFTTGICFGFVSGFLIDFYTGAPAGLFSLIYCVAFVVCGYISAFVAMESVPGRFLLAFGASLLGGCLVLTARWLKGPAGLVWSSALWVLGKSCITAVAAAALIPVVDWFWGGDSRPARQR